LGRGSSPYTTPVFRALDLSTRKVMCTRRPDRWQSFRYLRVPVDYPTGIHWKCVCCTICCQDTSTHERCVRVLPQEVTRICLETGLKSQEFSVQSAGSPPYTHEMRKSNGKCLFLRRGACSIYNVRPITCVFYPFFLNRNGDTHFRFELTPERCKGLGLGSELTKEYFRHLFTLAKQHLELAGEDLVL